QRFRGELTLLDSRGGARSEAPEDRGGALDVASAGNFGRSSPMETEKRPGRVSEMIDDDIPF
ncbi:MAG: single-stranded DNA-binding protein, partial [Methylovirgula sp.]